MARKKSNNALKGILTLVVVGIFITVNTFIPITQSVPTWYEILGIDKGNTSNTNSNNTSKPKPEGDLGDIKQEIHVIDVEQGSCTLIISGDGAVLVDAGEVGQEDKIIDYIENLGITTIDYAIATHPHSDHIGGMDDVINHFDVKNIIMPKLSNKLVPTTRVYENMLMAIDRNNVNVIEAQPVQDYTFGEAKMTVFSPKGDFDNLNDTSCAMKVTTGDVSVMITGDMEKYAENLMLKLGGDFSAQIFVMGHHGSTTSNSNALLDAINASYYVAQVGYENSYGHPHREIIAEVADRNGEFYRSDMDGDVVFKTDGKDIYVETSK